VVTDELSYDAVGSTRPGEQAWPAPPAGFGHYARTVPIGHGAARWRAVTAAVLDWQVKTRSGFDVRPVDGERLVREGADYRLVARIGPVAVHEPVRVVAVVDEPARCGFAYGTLAGHPVSGEEAFVVHRGADGGIFFTLRSLTRPAARGGWRYLFPVLLAAQAGYRRRYLRAFTADG
jgi:uncharacterized protein (UPF0548 family)